MLPFITPDIDQSRVGGWVPQAVVMTVRSPQGGVMQIDTVRLYQRPGG